RAVRRGARRAPPTCALRVVPPCRRPVNGRQQRYAASLGRHSLGIVPNLRWDVDYRGTAAALSAGRRLILRSVFRSRHRGGSVGNSLNRPGQVHGRNLHDSRLIVIREADRGIAGVGWNAEEQLHAAGIAAVPGRKTKSGASGELARSNRTTLFRKKRWTRGSASFGATV